MTINKVCEQCGNEFKISRKREETKRFCSKACLRLHESAHGRPASYKTPIPFTCQFCGNIFTMKLGFVNAYRKKHGKDPMYCNMKCSDAGRKKSTDAKHTIPCANCGELFTRGRTARSILYRMQKYCSPACKEEGKKKRAADRFNRGEYKTHIKRNGYLWISVPSHITGKKHGILEHRHIMSKKLGRPLLKDETVHHIDGNRQNNDPSNLELFSSRHGPGQRVRDKVAFAIDILRLYPEFGREAGVELVAVGQVNEPSPC